MGLKTITPADAQVDADFIRLHSHIDTTLEDDLIERWIIEAQKYCQHYTGRAIGEQTLELALDEFPGWRWCSRDSQPDAMAIELPYGPVTSVTSVSYVDLSGQVVTMDPSAWVLDDYSVTARVLPAYGQSWPAARCALNSLKVRYVTGYFPEEVSSAVALLVGLRYENREGASSKPLTEIPHGIDSILDTIRVWGR
jgi:uncharacterized phiE125 gp8 family phage protein